jgi:hypothetical protein
LNHHAAHESYIAEGVLEKTFGSVIKFGSLTLEK